MGITSSTVKGGSPLTHGRCKFYTSKLTVCTLQYIKIIGNWLNHCKHEIIIPSTAEQYRVTFGCWFVMADELFIVVTRPRCILFTGGKLGGSTR